MADPSSYFTTLLLSERRVCTKMSIYFLRAKKEVTSFEHCVMFTLRNSITNCNLNTSYCIWSEPVEQNVKSDKSGC